MNIIQKDSDFKILQSQEDQSVNFIADDGNDGFLEARYVRREDNYFIVYLSSQTGCMKACRMCHLTATGQNKYINTTPDDFEKQAEKVLQYYDNKQQAQIVHFNFMARGEPLDNPHMINNSHQILKPLSDLASERQLHPKFLVSTIMPYSIENRELTDIFNDSNLYPEMYYSIYGIDPKFRKKWLPRAIHPEKALAKLKHWQDKTGKTPKIHFAFIKEQNDREQDVIDMCQLINDIGLKVNFNIVRYNPYSEKYGEESDESVIQNNVDIMREMLKPERHRIVPKVGFDVKASCGMFIEKR